MSANYIVSQPVLPDITKTFEGALESTSATFDAVVEHHSENAEDIRGAWSECGPIMRFVFITIIATMTTLFGTAAGMIIWLANNAPV